MSIRKAIRQIQELAPNKGYAIVFNQRLHADDLNQLKEICQAGNVKALILTDARVVPLEQVFAAIGTTTEDEIAKALAIQNMPEPSPDLISNLDVTEATGV